MNDTDFFDESVFTVHQYKDRADWLEHRQSLKGVGGSDASAACGQNHFKSNLQLWKEKTGRATAEDISDKPYVRFGTLAEDPIRQIFALLHEDEFDVWHGDHVILQNNKHPHWLYSPDGLLIRKSDGKKGILEIKTVNVNNADYFRMNWGSDEVPLLPYNYYTQTLHGLNVTGYEFVHLIALVRYPSGYVRFIERTYTRDEAEFGLELVASGIDTFWHCVETDTVPAEEFNYDLI